MIIEKCSQIEFDLCIWTYLGRWGTDVICVSAEMRFCLNHYLVKNVSFLRSLPARGVWIEITPIERPTRRWSSLPARGVWIEIINIVARSLRTRSLPARGVWIEISGQDLRNHGQRSRSPQGECGLKYAGVQAEPSHTGRSPQGECGLKYHGSAHRAAVHAGRSPQGECGLKCPISSNAFRRSLSLPARGVWIEIDVWMALDPYHWSLPVRGVWIEMCRPGNSGRRRTVAPRKGSVD